MIKIESNTIDYLFLAIDAIHLIDISYDFIVKCVQQDGDLQKSDLAAIEWLRDRLQYINEMNFHP